MESLDQDVDPRVVGPFELVARLGAGGMGVAYLARALPLEGLSDELAAAYRLTEPDGDGDPAESRLVVVKMILPGLLDGQPTALERFDREIDAVRTVVSDRVPALIAAAPPSSPRPWFAMDYIAGSDLCRVVEKAGPLAPGPCAAFGLALVDALRAIHGAGLLHRDLKPQNVVLGPDGPVVLDFGLAVLAERRTSQAVTKPGEAWGSWPYASYEQLHDFPKVKEPADVYALGAVLFFALTGRPPYPVQPLLTPPNWSGVHTDFLPLLGQILVSAAGQRPDLDGVDMGLRAVLTQADLTPEVAAEQLRALVHASGLTPELPPEALTGHVDPLIRAIAQKAVDDGAAPDEPWAGGASPVAPDLDPGFYGVADTDESEWAAGAGAPEEEAEPQGYTPTVLDPARLPQEPAPHEPAVEAGPAHEAPVPVSPLPTSYVLAPPRPARQNRPPVLPRAALQVAAELRKAYAHRGDL
ncbi:serine/threonine protein kinase [Streptomyces finlayi]|uniref:serine/threonine protein kinase n=1 Tax=Streptomyces finlayi TaxID=67296 RepID=UPI00162AA0CD|nr:serine/threonine-protein kinase [Streptomyces finlayi]